MDDEALIKGCGGCVCTEAWRSMKISEFESGNCGICGSVDSCHCIAAETMRDLK
jgi:hypothetical protein